MAVGYNEYKNDPRVLIGLKKQYNETLELIKKLNKIIANVERYPEQYKKREVEYLKNALRDETAKAESLKKNLKRMNITLERIR